MREKWLLGSNTLSIFLLTLLLVVFQTTVWFQLFGNWPAPLLFLIPVVYVSIYRSAWEGMALTYFLAFFLASATIRPTASLAIAFLMIFFSLQMFKSRIYWEGPGYFTIVVTGVAMFYVVFDPILSYLIEARPIYDLTIFDRLLCLLPTVALTAPVYRMFAGLDKITEKARLSEPGSHAV